jgi:hypothetical protein
MQQFPSWTVAKPTIVWGWSDRICGLQTWTRKMTLHWLQYRLDGLAFYQCISSVIDACGHLANFTLIAVMCWIRKSGRMTFTFNPNKYSELLAQYQPKLIRTEAENEQALVIAENLMHRSSRSPEEDELYDLLITLIEKFEQEYWVCKVVCVRG